MTAPLIAALAWAALAAAVCRWWYAARHRDRQQEAALRAHIRRNYR